MTKQYNDRRYDTLGPNSKFAIKTPEGKCFHVHSNESLAAMLEDGRVPQDSLIQMAKSTNHSSVTK
jgi:hypothetical protein